MLKEKDSIFDKIIPHIKGNSNYKFNNFAIYKDDINDEFTLIFWKLGIIIFEGFISQLAKISSNTIKRNFEGTSIFRKFN